MRDLRPVEGESWERWMHQVRRAEFELTLVSIPLPRGAQVLEVGSGDGFQLDLLRQRFDHVFSLDPYRRPSNSSNFVFAEAERLPFPACSFDLVFSSNVVEHLADQKRAMEEGVRVLRPGGYMAHAVPSRFWKAASLLLNPVGYPLRVAEKWWTLRHVEAGSPEARTAATPPASRPGALQVLGRWFWPPIHGAYPSHLAEYLSFGRTRWRRVFARPGLRPVAEAPLVCATQFGLLRFRLLYLRRWLGRRGLGSSLAFVSRKVE